MSFLISLVTFVGILIFAVRGTGYRSIYFALFLFALILGVVTIVLTPTSQQLAAALASGNEALARGTQLQYDYSVGIALWFLVLAFGAFLGGIVYRAPASPTTR